ncbi:MAG: segregation/condensation protein A [Oscillospiraceae bacterium]|nr:segregation/condensation protein A [Oscillospiraceae bacterium]
MRLLMEALSYKLENFEGPLDLLLHLVARRKLELWEINIYELIDQYLEFIGELSEEKLEPTSEFIEMAARLVYMKSAALLPRREESEEMEKELTGRLIEYQLCKKMAERLRDLGEGISYCVREPLDLELPGEYSLSHEASILLEAYMSIMGKSARRAAPAAEPFEEIVTAPVVSVQGRIINILRGVRRGGVRQVQELFKNIKSRSEAVATFLGLLELMRAGRLIVADDGSLSEGRRRRRTDEREDV